MAEDILLKHEELVFELKNDLGNEQFDSIFNDKTKELTKPEIFLIKMEMSRLMQPIDRFIDLRGLVNHETKLYEYNNKQHFMDEVAIETFKKGIEQYGDYTVAVYESVYDTVTNAKNNNFTFNDEKNIAPPQHNVNVIKFASYENRVEERMNYSIKITIDYNDKTNVPANTSDISISGCRVKLPSENIIRQGELLFLHLVGLEQDFDLGLKQGIQYEVVAVEKHSEGFNHVRLKRTYIEKNAAFDNFLNNFIHSNKRRYKVNLDNTLDAVVSKGYEQYYIPRVTSLYVFLSKKNGLFIPNISLTTENNTFIQRYFTDERKVVCLYSILNHQRITHLLTQQTTVKEDYLYTFTHVASGKIYYYSATRSELNRNEQLKDLFLGFGSRKESWQCFKIQVMPSYAGDAYIPLSLPNTASKDVEKLNREPTPRVQGILKNVKYLVLLTSVGNAEEVKSYQQISVDRSLIPELKSFGHAKHKTSPEFKEVALEYVNLRASKRYLYKTAVNINSNGQHFSGHTLDFSVQGLQLKLDQPVSFKKGDTILISLPELQKITKQHQLTELEYEVMAISKTFVNINLKANNIDDTAHTGITFFNQLIDNNKDKLKVAQEQLAIPGLSLALRNMITKSICQFPFYLCKEAAHFKTSAIGFGLYPSTLHTILQSFGMLNKKTDFSSILTKEQVVSVISPNIKNHSRQAAPLAFTLVINLDPRKDNINDAITSECVLGDNYSELYEQVGNGIKSNLIFIMRLYISRTGRPDIDYLANELKYVTQYAIHKAKDLEDILWSITGVGDAVDVTEEAMRHLQLNQEHVTQMQNRKSIWLNRFR